MDDGRWFFIFFVGSPRSESPTGAWTRTRVYKINLLVYLKWFSANDIAFGDMNRRVVILWPMQSVIGLIDNIVINYMVAVSPDDNKSNLCDILNLRKDDGSRS